MLFSPCSKTAAVSGLQQGCGNGEENQKASSSKIGLLMVLDWKMPN